MSEYRHEYKYECTMQKLLCIKNQIETIMQPDSHVGEDGGYTIRSLYFDDYNNRCYYENINGTDPREKFRIRIYNGDSSFIRLELKKKERGKTKKISCSLTEELCRAVMRGENLPIDAVDSAVYRKFCLQQNTRLLGPKVIVEYDRIPFVYPDGNVRVTFDLHIRSSDRIQNFLDKEIVSRTIMPNNQHILEVKFDEYLPDFIYQSVQVEKLRQTAFSKYYMCRKYGMGGIFNEHSGCI